MRVSSIKSMIQIIFISFVIVTGLSGCGALTAENAKEKSPFLFPSEKVLLSGESKIADADVYIQKFALMALFANVVYREDIPAIQRNEDDCKYNPLRNDFGMPPGSTGKWERLNAEIKIPKRPKAVDETKAETETETIRTCSNKAGLSYEVYVHRTNTQGATSPKLCDPEQPGSVDEAVIAFRGTESDQSNFAEDAANDLFPIFNIEAKGYAYGREVIRPLIALIKKNCGRNIRIYTTGHSLGGGFAQQAGYLSKDITEVFAFNSSPVTDWPKLTLNNMVYNPTPTVYRINQLGEALNWTRGAVAAFSTPTLGRSDYVFNFPHSPAVSAHSIAVLSCNMARRIACTAGDTSSIFCPPTPAGSTAPTLEVADHDFPKEFAARILDPHYPFDKPEEPNSPDQKLPLATPPLCPPGSFINVIDEKFYKNILPKKEKECAKAQNEPPTPQAVGCDSPPKDGCPGNPAQVPEKSQN